MTTENDNTTCTADAGPAITEAGEAAGAGGTSLPGTSALLPPRPWFRQLLDNLYAGLRISLSLRVEPASLSAAPAALAVLAAADLVINLLVSFLLIGRTGYFSYPAITGFYFHLPLFLLFGLLTRSLLFDPSLLVRIPIALIAASIPIELCHAVFEAASQSTTFNWLQDYLDAPHYYRFFWWWSTASLLFLFRLPSPSALRRAAVLLLFLIVVVSGLWYFPRADLWLSESRGGESGELRVTDDVLAAQPRLLDRQLAALLPGTRGERHLYFVGFAGDGSQDVFLKEVTAAGKLFKERFGTSGRSVLLANNPRSATTLPFATASNLERALARVGEVMNRDRDVLFLYLTSHGSKEHELAVNNQPLDLKNITPGSLRGMLDKSRVKWKVVVVSACYSGGFIDELKDDKTMIITAADATHESFGCGNGENFTWFGEAYLNEALRQSSSFTEAFEKARATIGRWEEDEHETPSNPQIWIGREIGEKLRKDKF
jgi:hypothetical protein